MISPKYDIESEFNKHISTCCKRLIDSQKFGKFTRRVLQEKCSKKYATLLRMHKANCSEDEIISFLYKINLLELLKIFGKFFIFWVFGFVNIWLAYLSSRTKYKRAVVFDGDIETFSSAQKFYETYTEILKPLLGKDSSVVIARSKTFRGFKNNILFVKRVPYDLINYCDLSFLSVLHFLRWQFFSLFELIKACFENDTNILYISMDFLALPYVRTLSKHDFLLTYVKTNSEYNYQQFWLEDEQKNYDYFFVWYSLNTKYFKFKNLASYDPFLNDLGYIEKTVTWSEWHKRWIIMKFPSAKVQISPPLNFGQGAAFIKKSERSITIFDVYPRDKSLLQNLYINPENFYYSPLNCIRFVEDIVSICHDLKIEVLIKNKRKNEKFVNEQYSAYLIELGQKPFVQIIDADTDVEALIMNTTLSISIPFTSTNYVAAYNGKSSVYYDPTGNLEFDDREDGSSLIEFINNKNNLRAYLNEKFLLPG